MIVVVDGSSIMLIDDREDRTGEIATTANTTIYREIVTVVPIGR
jgi:hypothetical protein